jgi:hypothetical protein
MRDVLVRAGRTAAQAFLGAIVTSGILLTAASGEISASAFQAVGISALFAAAAAIVSFLQNLLEEKTDVVVGTK